MRGIIASDIDRTLTDRDHKIPQNVIDHLKNYHDQGFEIIFLTGRTFAFAQQVLAACEFPFHLGVQNGAEVLKFPEKEFRMQKFLTKEVVKEIFNLSDFNDRDFVLYSGAEHGDYCFYNPKKFTGRSKEYVDRLIALAAVNWKEIDSIEQIEGENFPMIRLFGTLEEMKALQKKVLEKVDVNCVILHDVATDGYFVMMITAKGVNKGEVLKKIIDHYDWNGCVIGCGDDLNDMSLFDAVDISIGMENGHPQLLKKATIIAKPSYNMGIIDALNQAVGMIDG